MTKDRVEWMCAIKTAKASLKPGDRVGVTKCPGTKRVITFSHFDGPWLVSKSGINDYSPRSVYSINGKPVDFMDDLIDYLQVYGDDIDDEDDNFQPCDNCDLPDACADFGCATKAGLRHDDDLPF